MMDAPLPALSTLVQSTQPDRLTEEARHGPRPAEVTSILKKEIETYKGETSLQSVGTVLSVGDGVARMHGLDAA
jgi:hypothetical protein